MLTALRVKLLKICPPLFPPFSPVKTANQLILQIYSAIVEISSEFVEISSELVEISSELI